MQPRKIAAALALGVVLCSGSFVLGQNTQTGTLELERRIDDADNDLDSALRDERKAGVQKTAEVLSDSVGNAANTKAVLKKALSSYYTGDDTKAAIRLQALEIAQNQRIIELLEKLAAEKKD